MDVSGWPWGSIPDWVSAFATPLAVGALIVEATRSRRERRDQVELAREERNRAAQRERERQVASVSTWLEVTGGAAVYELRAFVENAGELAVYDVTSRLVTAHKVEDKFVRVIAPRTRCEAGSWMAVRLGEGETVDLVVEFTDLRGRRWRRQGADYLEITEQATS